MPIATVPAVTVSLSGEKLNSGDMEHLADVRIHQVLSLPVLCELRFVDPSEDFSRLAGQALGSPLSVAVADQTGSLFSGEVTAVDYEFEPDAGRIIRIRAYDLLHRLRKRRPLRTHTDIAVVDLAEELVADLGLTVKAQLEGPKWQRIFQSRQSDWELLRDLSERAGMYFALRDGTLTFMTLEGDGREASLTLGTSLLEARIALNADSGCRTVSVSGWSPLIAEQRTGEASEARLDRKIAAEAPASAVGGSDERTLVDVAVETDAQAEAAAQAALDHLVATEVVLRGTAEGNPLLTPGIRVEVAGIGELLSGSYVLTDVEHLLDEQLGYICRVTSAPPELTARDQSAIATLGEVTAVDDPDRLGRVKVSLTAFGDLETDWIGVLAPGAGRGKGLVLVPDIGDRVLLLCPRGDPAHCIVIGGLYGADGAPDETVDDRGVRRFTFLTPGGHRIRLDDDANMLSIEDVTGNSLRLGPESVVLQAKVPLVLEAPGQAIRIRGASIDFEQA